MFQPIDHVSVSPTDGIGPTQGQRKTLTMVGEQEESDILISCWAAIMTKSFQMQFDKSVEITLWHVY